MGFAFWHAACPWVSNAAGQEERIRRLLSNPDNPHPTARIQVGDDHIVLRAPPRGSEPKPSRVNRAWPDSESEGYEKMDDTIREMVLTAYQETLEEALAAGHAPDKAHGEALTGAAMCLAAMSSMEDATARTQVESMNIQALLAA